MSARNTSSRVEDAQGTLGNSADVVSHPLRETVAFLREDGHGS
jgi:hypothetical protein